MGYYNPRSNFHTAFNIKDKLVEMLDYVLDHTAPCTWCANKDEAAMRAYHCPRTSTPIHAAALEHGEDWGAEYPGGC